MRAKEYECFVVKIQRLENLCRALQDERNVLYKKIKEAQVAEEKREEEEEEEEDGEEEQTGTEESLDNEASASSSVTNQAAKEVSATCENILKDLAAAFMVTHHVETPTATTNRNTTEEPHDLQTCSPVSSAEPTLPSPTHQETGNSSIEQAAPMPRPEEQEGGREKQQAHDLTGLKLLEDDMERVD